MVLIVRCLICKKELKYSYGDASELVYHIKSEHPLIDIKRSSATRRQFEEVQRTPTKEDLESFFRNSKVLHKLVDQESQTVNDIETLDSMNDNMGVPVGVKSKRDSNDSRKSSSPSQRTYNRESQSYKSARGSNLSKELPKRSSKDESFEESFQNPGGSLFESTRKTLISRTPPDSPKRKSSNARTPPDSPRRKAQELRTPPDSPRRNSLDVRTPPDSPRRDSEVRKQVELSSRKVMNVRTSVPSPREKSMEPRSKTVNPREATPLANGKHTRYDTVDLEVQEIETTLNDSTIKKNKLYRTSLQKWRPGGERITCPNCGETKQPIIRAHTERVAHSAFGASLIATCWPFCLAPCLFPEPFLEFIHCSVCDHYLGKYDHKQRLLSPNINNK